MGGVRAVVVAAPAAVNTVNKFKGRAQLLLLAALFAAPLVAVYWWTPGGSVNHGALIEPPAPLPALTLYTLEGAPRPLAEVRGKWTLVLVQRGPCAEICRRNLYNARQVRLAQGRNARRVRVLLLAAGADSVPPAEVMREHPQTEVWTADAPAMAQLAPLFSPRGDVYLVDPLGNLMMQFDSAMNPSLMRKDLARLLRVSSAG